MAAAQVFQAAVAADRAIPDGIARGEFVPLVTWLRTNVHSKGSLLPARELLTEATGRPLDTEPFKTHLRRRYLG
jgi:carboxypeptidase Taq